MWRLGLHKMHIEVAGSNNMVSIETGVMCMGYLPNHETSNRIVLFTLQLSGLGCDHNVNSVAALDVKLGSMVCSIQATLHLGNMPRYMDSDTM